MADKPILFSAPMVRALLDGRKTQTRRMMKPQGGTYWRMKRMPNPDFMGWETDVGHQHGAKTTAILHQVGDQLWVREAWRPKGWYGAWDLLVDYPADGATAYLEDGIDVGDWRFPEVAAKGNVPSIHMPRWASRLTLTVTDVRVQRLQDISEADAIAEGVGSIESHMPGTHSVSHIQSFRELWDSLNDKRGFGWGQNPWVVAYTFETSKGNIDTGNYTNVAE